MTLLLLLAAIPAFPGDLDEVAKHLGFIGYEIEESEDRLVATHAQNVNITVQEKGGGLWLVGFFIGTDHAARHPAELLSAANACNQESFVLKAYVDGDGDLALEAFVPGGYDKTLFGLVLEVYNREAASCVVGIDDALLE